MSNPDDPYASPPRDVEAGPARPAYGEPAGLPPYGEPAGPPYGQRPVPGAPPPPRPRGVGTAALVFGGLALVLGVTIVGGVMLGTAAIVLGVRARRRAAGGRATTAVLGIALGVLGIVVAGATWLWVQDDLSELQACRKESVSLAQDRVCEQQFRDAVQG